jgi:Na+/melibiose symporter-like transporter
MVLLMTTARGGRPHSKTRIDVIGAALATLAFGGIAWGLTSHQFVFLWAGAATLGVFLWSQHHMKTPMMPLGLYRRKTFAITNLMTFSLWGALNLMFFFMPMTFIAGWGFKEIDASAVFAPMSIFMALISTRAGRLADRIGAPPLMVTGALIVGAGYGIMGLLAPFQNLWGHMLPAMCLVGGGMALVVAPMTSAMMGAVPAEQSGIASGINNAVSRMAGLMFVAAMGGVASALYIGAGGPDSFGMLSDTPGHGTAMTRAFQGIAYISCGLCLGSAALAGLLLGARQSAARPGT